MDLWVRGLRPHEANVVVNIPRRVGRRRGWLRALCSQRASDGACPRPVAAAGDVDDSRAYLDLALSLLEPQPPRIVAIGGGSGTRQSRREHGHGAAISASHRVPASCDPDVLRKRLARVLTLTRLPASAYARR